jgi:surfeit locus 1 family protein
MSTNASSRIMTGLFAVIMLALAGFCVWLGIWQVQRLGEKEALIAAVDQRLAASPIPAPSSTQWPSIDLGAFNFQPLTLTGAFRYNQTITVFTSLTAARGPASGPGYWVMTPFVLADGGTVFINRGFVPAEFQEPAVTDSEGDENQVTITGILRPSEAAGFMTPEPDLSNRTEWVRDTNRLAVMIDPELAPIAPFYVDLPAGPPGELPQGGETVIEFPNNHLGYAYTWFGFAIVAVVMLGFWLWQQWRPAKG